MAFRVDGRHPMRFTLGAKLGSIIAVCGSLAMLALALVFLRQAQVSADEKAQSLAQEASRVLADRVGQDLKGMLSVVSTTNGTLLGLWSHGFRNRSEADALLEEMVSHGDERFGAWTVWKPNAFDGRDKDFVDILHSDGSGRYLTTWRRNGSKLVSGAVSGYGDPNATLYRDPLDRSTAFLSEPYYVVSDDGDHTAVISYAEPIIADKATLGVVGLDIALDAIARKFDSIPRPAGSAVALVSTEGTVISTNIQAIQDKSLLELRDTLSAEFQLARTQLIGTNTFEAKSDSGLRDWRKIVFGSRDKPWYLLTDIPLEPFVVKTTQKQRPTIIAAVGLLLSFLVVILTVVRTLVTKPLRRVERFIDTLREEGSDTIADSNRSDEIGSISRALEAVRVSERQVKQLQLAEKQRELSFSDTRRAELHRLADDLSSSVQAVASVVGETSRTIMQRAEAMAEAAAVSVGKTKTIIDASAAAKSSVEEVNEASVALRELIGVINVDLEQAGRLAADAAHRAAISSRVTVDLSSQASRIGDVVATISAIASRTNLLALNATIEAARAGEAGRGFAVVAQEVKALASQTSAATQDVEDQIKAMQRTAAEAAAALTTIGQSVEAINGLSVQISSATRWQSEATARIGQSVETAVEASGRMTATLRDVDEASSRTGDTAASMLGEMSALSDASTSLNDEVFKAIERIRAA